NSASPTSLVNCSVYSGSYGVRIVNGFNPGVEGTEIKGCDLVSVTYGVHAVNTVGGYAAPHIEIDGGHINATDTCIYLEKVGQDLIKGVLLYNSGSTQFIRLK